MKYALLVLALMLAGVGCGAADEPDSTDTGSNTGTTASDTDSDTSNDSTVDTDAGTDADTSTDDEAEASTDADTDTDIDNDAGSDAEGDSETLPEIADLSGLTLSGTEPAENLEAPEFEVMAADNTARTQDNLLGQPTVMWFFPAAEAWSIG